MKKILYTLITMSIFAVSCTQEVLVSRDHDLDAEVVDIETKMKMSALYCNLNDTDEEVDLQQFGAYLTEKSADVVAIVAPASVAGTSFVSWLNDYADEHDAVALAVTNENDGRLTMAALVDKKYEESIISHELPQYDYIKNAVLHFEVNGMQVVVTELYPAKNAIPADWEATKDAMLNDPTLTFVYDPDNLAERKAEIDYIISNTVDHASYLSEKYWLWCVNVNAPSHFDFKYGRQFALVDCYDNVPDGFIGEHHHNCIIEEYITAEDAYFSVNRELIYCGLVDCIGVHHSVYTPSCPTDARTNFLYSSGKLWNLFETLEMDKSTAWGAMHYPIMATLKVEE